MRLTRLIVTVLIAGCATNSQPNRQFSGALRHQKDGQRAQAKSAYVRLLTNAPKFEGARNNLAVLEFGDNNPDAALTQLQKELKHHPALRAARINAALVLLRQGKLDRARAKAATTVADLPGDAAAHLALGLILTRLDADPASANKAFARAIESGGPRLRAQAHFARGVFLAKAGKLAESAADFKAAARLRQDAVARYNRALILWKQSNGSDAVFAVVALGELSLAATLDDNAPQIPYLQALIYYRNKNYKAARDALTRVEKVSARHQGLHMLAGLIAWNSGKVAAARQGFSKEVALWPDSGSAWFNLGLTQVSLDNLAAAHAAFERAAKIDPSDAHAVHNRNAVRRILGP